MQKKRIDIDIILMDIQMPMNGYEAIKKNKSLMKT
jgi:CheY-like chemotaxis protein